MTVHKDLSIRDDVGRVYIKKMKDDENSPVLMIAFMRQFNDYKNTKERAKGD